MRTPSVVLDDRNVTSKEIKNIDERLHTLSISNGNPEGEISSRLKCKSTEVPLTSPPNSAQNKPLLKYENFLHILELYNFPKEFQTFHLDAELIGFQDSGFYLKWVDDSHCLAIFSSNGEATRALSQISGLIVKARRMNDASLASKLKLAGSPGDWAMPYKKRPATTSATARRMISSHLGIRNSKDRSTDQVNKEKVEEKILTEARARAEAIRKAQKALWEDD